MLGDMKETCALDVAERGEVLGEQLGPLPLSRLLGVTHQRVSQELEVYEPKLRAALIERGAIEPEVEVRGRAVDILCDYTDEEAEALMLRALEAQGGPDQGAGVPPGVDGAAQGGAPGIARQVRGIIRGGKEGAPALDVNLPGNPGSG